MELILTLAFVTVLVVIATAIKSKSAVTNTKFNYLYKAKDHIMTRSEEQFFKLLSETVSEKYYVFPQIHLSAVLDHKIPKQNWKGAFAHINGKSVDFVLCDKTTLKPTYAIELDDFTHKHEKRIERDERVEQIFAGAGVPLVRFADLKSITHNDIVAKLSEAYQNLR